MTRRVASVAVSAATYLIDHTYDYLLPPSLCDSVTEGMRVVVPFGRGNRRTEAFVLGVRDEDGDTARLKQILYSLDRRPVVDGEGIRLALWLRERCFCTFYDALKAMLPSGIFYSLQTMYYLAEPYAADSGIALKLAGSDKERRLIALAEKGADIEAATEAVGKTASKLLGDMVARGILRAETSAVRGVGDKTIKLYSLAVGSEEAREYIDKNTKRAPAAVEVLNFILENGEAAADEITYFTGRGKATAGSLVKKGLLGVRQAEVYRRPPMPEALIAREVILNAEQQAAADRLGQLADSPEPKAALLYGVTGSGKTQVYISLVKHVTKSGRGAMVLVPEIALTPQLMQIFRSRFDDRIAILHSALTAGQRSDEWKRIRSGEADIVLGTRSAVFAPVKNLGAIIIDEEQENSYKSDNTPRYHARDVARYRVTQCGGLLLLGSATPSVESYYQALEGKYELITLRERFNERELPNVIISDMRRELINANPLSISSQLAEEIEKNLNDGSQTILFLNRRGNSRQIVCGECGYIPECDNCSVSLTFHSANNRLMCHYCGSSKKAPDVCPECGGILKQVGGGTQRCEEDIAKLFPQARILRMDADTTSARRSHEHILQQFRDRKADILLGTQMVAKGLDFDNVTLVGVINADQSLYVDDFRAHERTFSLVTQVVGRAGRGDKPGRAVLQTLAPQNPVLYSAAMQDYAAFFESEIELRRRLGYPPFSDLISLTVSGANESGVLNAALFAREAMRKVMRDNGLQGTVLGPAQAAVFRVNSRYRYRIMLICRESREIRRAVQRVLRVFRGDRKMKDYLIYADINPSET